MLKLIGFLIKISAFALIVLVVANYFHVADKTVSDHIRTQLSHAENAEIVTHVKDWAQEISKDQKDGIVKKTKAIAHAAKAEAAKITPQLNREESNTIKTADEEIPPSERQKLKALMRELNSAPANSN